MAFSAQEIERTNQLVETRLRTGRSRPAGNPSPSVQSQADKAHSRPADLIKRSYAAIRNTTEQRWRCETHRAVFGRAGLQHQHQQNHVAQDIVVIATNRPPCHLPPLKTEFIKIRTPLNSEQKFCVFWRQYYTDSKSNRQQLLLRLLGILTPSSSLPLSSTTDQGHLTTDERSVQVTRTGS